MPPRPISNQSSSAATAAAFAKISANLSNNFTTNAVTANTLTVSSVLSVTGNVSLTSNTSDMIINMLPVRDTLVNCALPFPSLTVGAGTSNGNGTTHTYADNYMGGNVFVSASSTDASWPSYLAFDKTWGVGSFWMASTTRGYTGLPPATAANTAQIVLPSGGSPFRVQGEWLQIQFPIAIAPAAYHVFPRHVYINRTASRFRLVASNNATNLAGANATVQDAKVWTQLHYANVEPQAIIDGQTWKPDGRRYRLANVTTASFNTFRFITEAVIGGDSGFVTVGELVITGFPTPVYS